MKKNTKAQSFRQFPELTVKQERFAHNYVKNAGNGAKAARDAGYKSLNGGDRAIASENLAKPHIEGAINEIALKAISAENLTDDDIINGLLKESGLDGKGGPDDAQHGGRIRGLEILAKSRAMLVDKTIQETPDISGIELCLKMASDSCPNMAVGVVLDLHLDPATTAKELTANGYDDVAQLVLNTLQDASVGTTELLSD